MSEEGMSGNWCMGAYCVALRAEALYCLDVLEQKKESLKFTTHEVFYCPFFLLTLLAICFVFLLHSFTVASSVRILVFFFYNKPCRALVSDEH